MKRSAEYQFSVLLVSERDTIRGANSSWCSICIYIYIYIYIYMEVRTTNSSACYAYELGHCYFLYVPAVSNVVTTGNGTCTKNVLKWNCALGFEFSIQFSVFVAITIAKVNLFSTRTRSTVSFYSM